LLGASTTVYFVAPPLPRFRFCRILVAAVQVEWSAQVCGLTRDERDEALINRANWKYPAGAEVVAECWTAASDPALVVILETDDDAALMEIGLTWGRAFDITPLPAVSAEEGLKIGPDVMGRRQF
jgi:hypothetical protein